MSRTYSTTRRIKIIFFIFALLMIAGMCIFRWIEHVGYVQAFAEASQKTAAILGSEAQPPNYPGFTYLRKATYSCMGITNTVHEYQHELTGMEFVLIPGGTFMMGSTVLEPERGVDEAQHEVTVSPFLISKTEVTQAMWYKVMRSHPSSFQGLHLPVESITWYEAMSFCEKAGLTLPTEAQWEFSCRAWTQTPFNLGPNITINQVNYNGCYPYLGTHEELYRLKTVPVASLPNINGYGLFDTHGNVWEWCLDWYNDYPTKPTVDPKGPNSGSRKVVRGGSWNYAALDSRSAERCHWGPDFRSDFVGFRVCNRE